MQRSFSHLLSGDETRETSCTPRGRLATALLWSLLLLLTACEQPPRPPQWTPGQTSLGVLQNPADIIRFKDRLVTTELYSNRLAILEDLDDTTPQYFDPQSIGQTFRAPHHLAISPTGSLLISNGWGSSIVAIDDLDGSGWKEFAGLEDGFNAPHGICVDADGWIYVADSLNFRITRFRDMEGSDWEVFSDHDGRIGYARQLVCNDEGLWITNSYDKGASRERGSGSNVLLVRDFSSGQVEEIATTHSSKITGVYPTQGHVVISVWRPVPNLRIHERANPETPRIIEGTAAQAGIPYALYHDADHNRLIQVYFGSLRKNGAKNRGGLMELIAE